MLTPHSKLKTRGPVASLTLVDRAAGDRWAKKSRSSLRVGAQPLAAATSKGLGQQQSRGATSDVELVHRHGDNVTVRHHDDCGFKFKFFSLTVIVCDGSSQRRLRVVQLA
eukprot:2333088-Rhodomonas_salina.1